MAATSLWADSRALNTAIAKFENFDWFNLMCPARVHDAVGASVFCYIVLAVITKEHLCSTEQFVFSLVSSLMQMTRTTFLTDTDSRNITITF